MPFFLSHAHYMSHSAQVLLQQVSESIGVSKGQFARQTRRPNLLSRNRADPDTDGPPGRSGRRHRITINNRVRSDGRHIVRAGPNKQKSCLLRTRSGGLE